LTLTLIVNILGIDQDVENRKQTSSTAMSLGLAEKFGELWPTNKKVTGKVVDPPKCKIRQALGQLRTLSANISTLDVLFRSWKMK